MLVQAEMDRMGNITVRPVADRWAKRFARHVEKMGGGYYLDVFFQEGMGATELLENYVPIRHRKALKHGYTVRFRVDGWIVAHWYGWDCDHILTREMS